MTPDLQFSFFICRPFSILNLFSFSLSLFVKSISFSLSLFVKSISFSLSLLVKKSILPSHYLAISLFHRFCCSSQIRSLISAARSKSRLVAALSISLVRSSIILSLLSSSRYCIKSSAEGFSLAACLLILS